MAVGTESRQETDLDSGSGETPSVSICESCPGKSVFIESGNTDGWIASDTTEEITR